MVVSHLRLKIGKLFSMSSYNITLQQQQLQRQILEARLISVLNACKTLNQVKHVHAHVLRRGLDQSSFVLAKLLRMLAKHGIPTHQYSRLLFDGVRHPNAFLWTALIRGYSLDSPAHEPLLLYTRMRRLGVRPLSFTFSSLFKSCAASRAVEAGRQIHGQTISIGGFESDLFVCNPLIDMYVRCGALDCARKVFDEMSERDVISWTSLIVAYAKSGDMAAAEGLFDGFIERDMVAWTAMITGYAQNAKPREALRMFDRMQAERIEIDEVTLVGAVSACAQLGATKYANWIRNLAERTGYGPVRNVIIGSALIDMYAKCGSVGEAYRVFDVMTERNVFSYSAMIVGFAMHGKADEAMRLFSKMVETEVTPNAVTFIGVLTACSHAGMVEQGWKFFEIMQNDYEITPSADHYACMVDILGRAGHVEEALELVKTMPIEPHGGVWGALLGACRIHGKPHIAEIAGNHLFELEPNGIGNYVLLSNIYASAGMWDEVSKVRKLMRKNGLKKNPGCSWVETKDGVIHEFFAGDVLHPKSKEIKEALDKILERLRLVGYMPNLSSVVYDVSDKEKERMLKNHSEKLALAFGLLSTNPGSTIRIVKNLRACEDCHLVMCGTSLLEKREIVVRDNMRFHHFREGVCSCGGFW